MSAKIAIGFRKKHKFFVIFDILADCQFSKLNKVPKISIPLNHKIGQAEAINRIKTFVNNSANLQTSISGLKVNWMGNRSDFTFLFNKILVKGTVIVGNDVLSITGTVPFIILPLKGKIVTFIKNYAENILK